MTARRASLASFAAPLAFLIAVTVAVLLVRSSLSSGDKTTGRTDGVVETVATTSPSATRPRRTTPAREARFYRIQAGDTLETVAAKHDTTVEQLLVLNPDVDPVALGIGERIRVK